MLPQDLRYTARLLLHNKSFAATAILTLALVMGANTSIFSVVYGILFRPMPYPDSDRLVFVSEYSKRDSGSLPTSPPDFFDYRDRNHSLQNLSAFMGDSLRATLSGRGEPASVALRPVSFDFFDLLQIRLQLGRAFREAEDRPDADRVMVLSHRLWQLRFSGDPRAVGSVITMNGRPWTVIGVAPDGFDFPQGCDLWIPLRQDRDPSNRGSHMLTMIGRLKPGVTLEQASQEVKSIASALENLYPATNRNRGVELVPFRDQLVGPVRPLLLTVLAAVQLVLLIACANLATLLLSQAPGRAREMAIRASLGAGRGRMIRQLLMESTVLSLAGGVLGLLLSFWGIELIKAYCPVELPGLASIRIDVPILVYSFAIAALTGMIFGLFPALQLSGKSLNEMLRAAGGLAGLRISGFQARGALVVFEIALALVLLVGAGLLIKSFVLLSRVDPGFNASGAVVFNVSLPGQKYQEDARVIRFFEELQQRLRTIPGVQDVGATSGLPLRADNESICTFGIEGMVYRPGERPASHISAVTPHYFAAMKIPLLKGRLFDDHDMAGGAQVVLVNQAFAEKFFPGQDPLGKKITHGFSFGSETPGVLQIAGVVDDVRETELRLAAEPQIYVAHAQAASSYMDVVVRVSRDPSQFIGSIRSAVRSIDPDLAIADVSTLEEVVSHALGQPRFSASLVLIFGLLALAIASIGIYGVMACLVSQGMREIGIRMALGAGSAEVKFQVVRQGTWLSLLGISVGLTAAAGVTRLLSRLLFQVPALDASVFLMASVLFLGITALACYIPARRAASVDPMRVLRYE